MRTSLRESRVRLIVLAAIALVFGAILALDVWGPVTPMEQQAMIGAILVLGVPALWLL